jgi:tetrahydromethanopterin S-methyltransferase subunit G
VSTLFSTSTLPLAKHCSEKYGKSLVGRTDLEDALKRLDKLTQEEAWMVTVEVLRAGHTIGRGVRVVREPWMLEWPASMVD